MLTNLLKPRYSKPVTYPACDNGYLRKLVNIVSYITSPNYV